MTECPRVNFVMRFSKFTRGSSVFHTSMRRKQVEFNLYIYTLSKLSRFGQEISVFNTHQGGILNSRRNGHLIFHVCGFMEKWMSKFFLCSTQQKTLEV